MLRIMRFSRSRLLWASLALAAALLGFGLLQGDLLEEFSDLRHLFFALLTSFGFAGSLILLYLEESGLPLPLPGDAILLYLGSSTRSLWLSGLLAVIAIAAGSSNLYLLSRRFGPSLLTSSRLLAFLYLSPSHLERAQGWFARWGAASLIFGRHIPGLRIPLTIVAGSLRLPYRTFLPSVIVSASLWVALWLTLGARFAPAVEAFFTLHSWLYFLVVLAILVFLAGGVLRALRTHQEALPGDLPR